MKLNRTRAAALTAAFAMVALTLSACQPNAAPGRGCIPEGDFGIGSGADGARTYVCADGHWRYALPTAQAAELLTTIGLPPQNSLRVTIDGTDITLVDQSAPLGAHKASALCVDVRLVSHGANPASPIPPGSTLPPDGTAAWRASGCAPLGATGIVPLVSWTPPWNPVAETTELVVGPIVAYQSGRATFRIEPGTEVPKGDFDVTIRAYSGVHNWQWGHHSDPGRDQDNRASTTGTVTIT